MYSTEYFQQQGAVGGKRTAKKLSAEERSESAKKAVTARWAKYRAQKEKEQSQ